MSKKELPPFEIEDLDTETDESMGDNTNGDRHNTTDSKQDQNETLADDSYDDPDNLSDEDPDDSQKPVKKKFSLHLLFFIIVAIIFIYAIVRLMIWNKGQESDYDPNADTTEFDTEPLDYIQPLSSTQLAGKTDDGVTTFLCLGNSPFSDDGDKNALSANLADTMKATVINGSFADSYLSMKNATYDSSYPNDGISLYPVITALTSGNFDELTASAALVSDQAKAQAKLLSTVDMTKIDTLYIMYDLSDYVDRRPVYDPGDDNNLVTCSGSMNAAIKLLQETYPYIRIVFLSTPASGKTIDDFYVDASEQDLGNGTLTDYMGHEANVATATGITFIDTFYGAINVENKNDYLVDDYHLNEAGAKAIAERVYELIGE